MTLDNKGYVQCEWRPDHDLALDVPVGTACGEPARYVILWLDGSNRYSPCCTEHAADVDSSAPEHLILGMSGAR